MWTVIAGVIVKNKIKLKHLNNEINKSIDVKTRIAITDF